MIISLYSKRRDTFCESHAHTALVEAIRRNDLKDAAELMTGHRVDLLSGIDVAVRAVEQRTLAEPQS